MNKDNMNKDNMITLLAGLLRNKDIGNTYKERAETIINFLEGVTELANYKDLVVYWKREALQGKLDKAKEALIIIADSVYIDCNDCSSNHCDPYCLYECAVQTAKKYLKELGR